MGLGDMENDVRNILEAIRAEIGDEQKKSEERQEKLPKEEPDIDEILKSLPDVMRKERRKARNMDKTWELKKAEHAREKLQTVKKKEPPKRAPGIVGNSLDKTAQAEKPRRHILIVDDDIRILKMIRELLKDTYDTAVAPSGELALKFLENHSTDLVLLDYMMPKQNGKEVLEKIRSNPVFAELPVIFLTGMSDSRKVKECLALHPQGYLLKPVKQEELLKRVAESFLG